MNDKKSNGMIDRRKVIIKPPIYVSEDGGCIAFLLHALFKTSIAGIMIYLFYLIIR